MDVHDLRKHPHLSVSGIGDYMDCGLLYRFSRIDKFPPEFVPDSLIFGTTIHKVMADFNQARIMGTEFGQDDFQGKFESYWSKTRQDNISFSEGKSFDFYLSQGKALLSEFHKKSREGNFTVLAVEEPFQFTLNGMEVPMIGVIDLIEEDESGTIIVADYKTASKAYSEDQVDKNLQMTVYQMAAIEMGYRDRQILLRLDCLIKTKTPKFVQYYTQRTENDLLRAQKKIPKIWDGIRKGVFIPNDTGWKCNHCTYKRHCKQWFAT